ncbi:Sapep family Mn(2+)-dependent dipeptidase [Pantoea sp. App145]|uniref:Sapep family Mn(2+)-dependent dipeptidase n=1 Tax=Pantoea sp. App145 TaxID=3071567 RepID=UPI003A811B2B
MPATISAQEKALLPLIQQWIDKYRDDFIGDLAQWIEIPSISRADQAVPGAPFGPECAAILQRVLSQAEDSGFKTEWHEGYAGSVIYGNHSRDIGLIGHLDVVPAGDNWSWPPFSLSRHGEFLIGRGVADNKGPGLMNIYLLKLLRDLHIPLHHNLRIVYGLAEETTMADMAWYAQHGPLPAYSIVTDGMFPVNNAQKGQLSFTLHISNAGLLAGIKAGAASNSVPDLASVNFEPAADAAINEKRVSLQGIAATDVSLERKGEESITLVARGNGGHAAFPEGTRNATLILLAALIELEQLDETELCIASTLYEIFDSPYGDNAGLGFEDEQSGKLTLNAGVWYSTRSGSLSIDCDIRYPVSCRGEEIMAILQQRLHNTGVSLDERWRDVSPFYLPESHPVITLLQQTWNNLTGREDASYAMGGVTHSKMLRNAITFGPGYRRNHKNTPDFLPEGHGLPHGADETIHLPSLLEAIPIYVIALIRLDRYLLVQQ